MVFVISLSDESAFTDEPLDSSDFPSEGGAEQYTSRSHIKIEMGPIKVIARPTIVEYITKAVPSRLETQLQIFVRIQDLLQSRQHRR